MIPFNHTEFIHTLTKLVRDKFIPMSRIDDAVRRILRVKYKLGLFENPMADESFVAELGSQVINQHAFPEILVTLTLRTSFGSAKLIRVF